MCLLWGALSVEPLIFKDFLVQVSPSLSDGVMAKSWKNEVRLRSIVIHIENFPITMEFSKLPLQLLVPKF